MQSSAEYPVPIFQSKSFLNSLKLFLMRNRRALVSVLCLSPIFFNFFIGFGENIDSYLIYINAEQLKQTGYVASRSWGVPLYEFFMYPIIYYFGIIPAKIYSFLWVILSQTIVFKYLRTSKQSELLSLAGVFAFSFIPSTIISGNTVLETSQGVFLGLCMIFSVKNYLSSKKMKYFYLSFVFGYLATLTRPDYIILPGSFFLTLLVFYPKKRKTLLAFFALFLSLGVPHLFLYKDSPLKIGLQLLDTGDPVWMKFVKTGIAYLAVLGLPFWLVSMNNLRKSFGSLKLKLNTTNNGDTLSSQLEIKPMDFFFVLVSILFLVRVLLLPDEIEYIYFWAVFLVLRVFENLRFSVSAIQVILAIALPNLVQVYFFARDQNGFIQWKTGVTSGILIQEKEKRQLNEFIKNDYIKVIQSESSKLGCQNFNTGPTSIFVESFPYSVDPKSTCAIASLKWYSKIRDVVFPGQQKQIHRYLNWFNRTVFVHNLPTDRGWRRFLRFDHAYPPTTEQQKMRVWIPPHENASIINDTCFWENENCTELKQKI